MSKYPLLMFKLITFSAILISGQRVLANEGIKTVEQKGEGKDWIEELKEEIREIDQERNVKGEIKIEKEKKKRFQGKRFLKKLELVYQKKVSI